MRPRAAFEGSRLAHVDPGGLISYGPDLPDMYRRCGVYVGRILGGIKPADLPIERPARFELVVNLMIAKGFAMTMKQSCCAPTRSMTEEERLPVLALF